MKISQLEDGINVNGGLIFGYQVRDPERYGVVEFSENNLVLSIEEKPKNPRSNYAIPGLYFYDNSVVEIAKTLKPSKRGEYEITDLNRVYLNNNQLQVKLLGKGSVWLDTGTVTSLQQASNYVQVIEERQGRKIGCIEEAAFRKGFIDKKQLLKLSKSLINSGYGKYLQNLIYR